MPELLGYAMRRIRIEQGEAQKLIADECGVTQTTVSRWEVSGTLPLEHVDCACRALKIDLRQLRQAIGRSLAGQLVGSHEALDAWRDAVATSRMSSDAKLVLFGVSLPTFVDVNAWIAEVQVDDLADELHVERDEVYQVWDEVTRSKFLHPIGNSGRIFKLKFPELQD